MLNKQTIFQASAMITIAALMGRVLGFFREIVIAHHYGVTISYDIYLVAITFPVLINTIFLYSIPNAIIPIYLQKKESEGRANARRFILNLFNIFGIFFLTLTGIMIAFAPNILNIYVPSLNQTQMVTATLILRVISAVVFLGGLFSILKSIFNAEKHFLLPALSPIILNLMVILSVLGMTRTAGILSIAIGMVSGYFFQLLGLIWIFLRKHIRYAFNINFNEPLLRKMFGMLFFVILIETIGQVYSIIDRFFIAVLPEGGISALSYANNLYQIPIGVFSIAVGTAIFPSIAEYATKENRAGIFQLYSKAIRSIFIIIIPIVFLILFFHTEIITLIFQRGAFDQSASQMTAEVLRYFSFGLIAYACHAIVVRMYYALGRGWILFLSTLASFFVKLSISAWAVKTLFQNGLALATSVAGIFNFLMLHYFLQKDAGGIEGRKILVSFLKIVILSAFSCGTAKMLMSVAQETSLLFRFTISFSVGAFLYIVFLHLLKIVTIKTLLEKWNLKR